MVISPTPATRRADSISNNLDCSRHCPAQTPAIQCTPAQVKENHVLPHHADAARAIPARYCPVCSTSESSVCCIASLLPSVGCTCLCKSARESPEAAAKYLAKSESAAVFLAQAHAKNNPAQTRAKLRVKSRTKPRLRLPTSNPTAQTQSARIKKQRDDDAGNKRISL